MKFFFLIFSIALLTSYNSYAQKNNFKSTKYSYEITVPESFTQISNRSPNMDVNFSSEDGSSINVVVLPLGPEFKNTTPHDLTSQMILDIFKNVDPEARIENKGRPTINGKKAFYYTLIFSPQNASYKLKQLTYTFYSEENRFILTMTSGENSFSDNLNLFESTAKSFEL